MSQVLFVIIVIVVADLIVFGMSRALWGKSETIGASKRSRLLLAWVLIADFAIVVGWGAVVLTGNG